MKTRPAQVDCFPFPPLEEYRIARSRKKGTRIYYYGVYIRDGALEAYAKPVNPEADNYHYHFSVQQFYALDYLRWIVNDQSLEMEVAVLQQRHKDAMPFIIERKQVRILCLSRFSEKAYEKRMPAENVEKLLDALGGKPDWFEISFFC